MKIVVLATIAVALAALVAPALAADDSDDDAATKADISKLATDMEKVVSSLDTLQTTVNDLVSAVDTIDDEVSDLKGRGQVAVVQTAPNATSPNTRHADTYLIGSSISRFPGGSVATDGRFTERKLPEGTYLFELQSPAYLDNVVCHSAASRGATTPRPARSRTAGLRFRSVCPRVWVVVRQDQPRREQRLDHGFSIFTSDGTVRFWVRHSFPDGWTFTDDKPVRSYTATLKITKLE